MHISYHKHSAYDSGPVFIDIKMRLRYNNIRRKACFSSGLTLKSDMLVNHEIDRWRTTLKSDILPTFCWSLTDNTKISHKERVYSTVVLLLSLSIYGGLQVIMKFTKEEARRRVLNCAKQYQKKLLNKKWIIIYREKQDNKDYRQL